MAAIWKGAITFGLVNIPVEVQSAVREDHISFRLLHDKDKTPVKYERVRQSDGKTVPWSEIVKGYEYAKGKYVVMEDKDFKAAAVAQSKTIDIVDFVKEAEIDPRYFETPYYLVPAKGGEKAYALLREAIRASGSVGIGKVIIRQKQHLAAVRVQGNALVLEIMRFANELVDDSGFDFPSADIVRPQELKMAEQLIGNLAGTFDPSQYKDEYRENVMKVIKAKMKGKKVDYDEPAEPESSGVIDIMERLRASIEQGKPSHRQVRAPRKNAAAKTKKPARAKRKSA